jgi:formamidopyrimidine-DNA glycosylase
MVPTQADRSRTCGIRAGSPMVIRSCGSWISARSAGWRSSRPFWTPASPFRSIAHIARDPFDPRFDDAEFARRLRSRHTGIKRALLDQSLISGVGNIYADEALWRARLHYARPTELLTRPVIGRLLASVREVMSAALVDGGTSFDRLYVNVNGESGY